MYLSSSISDSLSWNLFFWGIWFVHTLSIYRWIRTKFLKICRQSFVCYFYPNIHMLILSLAELLNHHFSILFILWKESIFWLCSLLNEKKCTIKYPKWREKKRNLTKVVLCKCVLFQRNFFRIERYSLEQNETTPVFAGSSWS